MSRTPLKPLLAMLMLIGLSGCAAMHTGSATTESIRHDMDAAAEESSKPAKPVRIEAVNNALLPPLAMVLPKVDSKPLEARFDLAVNDTAARQVYMAIASGTRYNMLVPPGVDGNITLNLKDVTVFDALEAIRELYGYEYRIDGTRIYIEPIALQTRLFQVNYLTATRSGSSSLTVESSSDTGSTTIGTAGTTGTTGTTGAVGTTGATGTTGTAGATGTTGGGGSSSSRVSMISNPRSNFWTELDASLKAIVGSANGRSVTINSMSGVIVVRAMPDEIKNVSAYLKASQISIERQVILEAKIVEVQLNENFQSGVNWAVMGTSPSGYSAQTAGIVPSGTALPTGKPLTLSTLGTTIATAAAGGSGVGATGALFGLAFNTNNFAALLNFMETQGDVHVLSSPRIATLNNQKAILKVGTDEYFITGLNATATVTTTTSTTLGSIAPIYTPMFSGIALDVTPSISESGEVILHVHPSVSSVTEKNKIATLTFNGGSGGSVPMASTSIEETDSIVRAHDGQIVVIGGLMSKGATDDQSGLPGLSKTIFGQTNKTAQKRELVILLKPTVVDADSDWSGDITRTRDRINGMASSPGARP